MIHSLKGRDVRYSMVLEARPHISGFRINVPSCRIQNVQKEDHTLHGTAGRLPFQDLEGRSPVPMFGSTVTRSSIRNESRTPHGSESYNIRVRMENHMSTCSERRPSLTRVRMEDHTAKCSERRIHVFPRYSSINVSVL